MAELGLVAALLGGVLTLLSPCSVLLLPAFFAYTFVTPGRMLARIMAFYLGLLTMLVPLGVAASTAGAFVNEHRDVLVVVMSSLIIVLGLMQASGVSLQLVRVSARPRGDGMGSVFVLGLVYGVAGVCSGPILGSVLAVAALQGDQVRGGALLAVYAAGMVLPLLVLAPLWDRWGARRRFLTPRTVTVGPIVTSTTNVAAGLVLVVVGTIFLFSEGSAGLFGVLSIDEQFAAESWVQRVGSQVPDEVLLAIGLLVAALAVVVWRVRARTRSATSSQVER